MLCYVNSQGVACTSINSTDIFNFIAEQLFLESFFCGVLVGGGRKVDSYS